jgi:hypothetical protein
MSKQQRITVQAAAHILGTSPSNVQYLLKHGRLYGLTLEAAVHLRQWRDRYGHKPRSGRPRLPSTESQIAEALS